MGLEDDWDSIRREGPFRAADAGMGMLRLALLFGSAVVALAMIAVPLLDNGREFHARDNSPFGLDMTTTGSISRGNSYTVRRSVLQSSPDAVCIIRADGRRSGDC